MIALVQRVTKASVSPHQSSSQTRDIGVGLCVLLGVIKGDTMLDVDKIAGKLIKLRLFRDNTDKMNLSLKEVQGSILLVPQFTLAAGLSSGNRPEFLRAALPDVALSLYNALLLKLESLGAPTKSGFFGEYMDVEIYGDGPVTIIIDSRLL